MDSKNSHSNKKWIHFVAQLTVPSSKPFYILLFATFVLLTGWITNRVLPDLLIFGITSVSNSNIFFCAFFFSITIITIIGLFSAAKIRANLLLLMSSLIISLYMAEGLVSIVNEVHQTKAQIARNQMSGLEYEKLDFRPLNTIFWDLRDTGVLKYPAIVRLPSVLKLIRAGKPVPEELLNPVPISQISGQPLLVCNENGSPVIEEFDQYGFNNDNEIYALSRIPIAIVGDSFAQGYCVPRKDSVAALLSNQRPTLNVGLAGNGPLKELATIREYLTQIKPDIVLWLYYEGNDSFNMMTEYMHPVLRHYLEDPNFSQNLIDRQGEVNNALIQYAEEKLFFEEFNRKLTAKRMLENNFLTLGSFRNFINQLHPRLKEVGPGTLFGQIMKQAKVEVEQWGGELYFVYLPSWKRYKLDYNFHKQDFLDSVTAEGIPVIDFSDYTNTLDDPLVLFPYRHYGHYTAEGYEKLANFIASQLNLNPQTAVEAPSTTLSINSSSM
ncbi:MAG: hypothetical protein MI864_03060 [Pseudomonadales bacterium]|nr:hypothetical protein [Pseudomonadales bacterium]